jgi:hypothetical protein
MLEDLAELYKDREERVKHGRLTLVVRQWDGSDREWVFQDPSDVTWRLVERCVFRENGERAFDKNDVETMKKKPLIAGQLVPVVNRVNGMDLEEEAKNSDAAQG